MLNQLLKESHPTAFPFQAQFQWKVGPHLELVSFTMQKEFQAKTDHSGLVRFFLADVQMAIKLKVFLKRTSKNIDNAL